MSHLADLKCPVLIHKENPIKFSVSLLTTHTYGSLITVLSKCLVEPVALISVFENWILTTAFCISRIFSAFYPKWRMPFFVIEVRWRHTWSPPVLQQLPPLWQSTDSPQSIICLLIILSPLSWDIISSQFPTCCFSSFSLLSCKILEV